MDAADAADVPQRGGGADRRALRMGFTGTSGARTGIKDTIEY